MPRTPVGLRVGLLLATLAGMGATAHNLGPRDVLTLCADVVPSLARAASPASPARPDSLTALAARRDPFRMSRMSAHVRYQPERGVGPGPDADLPPPPARPSLSLAGVILGSEPAALIDGLPGVEGTRVLRVGERHGVYQLRSVDTDRAVVTSPDTTWTLHVRTRSP